MVQFFSIYLDLIVGVDQTTQRWSMCEFYKKENKII